jgi:DNA-binding SARP family transcriptional activator
MDGMRIHLFGKLLVRIGDQGPLPLDSHQTEKLFCYLLLFRHRGHHREVLADLLCGECPTAQSKKHLRQLLWRLQSVVEACATPCDGPILLVDRDWVQVNPGYTLWLDVDILERASVLVQDQPGEGLDGDRVEVIRRAVDLYQDDLLVGWYEDWCLFERERLRNMYLELLDKMIGHCEAHQQYESGLRYGEQMLRYDPASERTYQRMMRLHYWAGARGAALHQYQRCVAALQKEVGVAPSKSTTVLFQQVRAGELKAPSALPPLTGGQDTAVTTLLASLKRFEVTLNEVHARVQSEIQFLQGSLGIQT